MLIPVAVLGMQILWASYGPDLWSYMVQEGLLRTTPVVGFVLEYILYFTFFALAIGVVLVSVRAGLSKVGFGYRGLKKILVWGLGGGLGLFAAVMTIGAIIKLLVPEMQPQPFEAVLRDVGSVDELVVMLVVGSVLAPLVEEVFFRGMVYPVIRDRLGVAGGIIISGLLFGMMHWDVARMVPLALGGMVLCYIYERSRTIYAPWLAHGIWNGIMVALVFLKLA